MIEKMRTSLREKKGFTLVELVVVLVILAILAALLMPSLTGYIDKAKDKRVLAEVHQVVTAAQSLADEVYALATDTLEAGIYEDAITAEDIEELSEIKGELMSVAINATTGKVEYVEMTLGGLIGYYTLEDGIKSSIDGYETAPPEEGEVDYATIAPTT